MPEYDDFQEIAHCGGRATFHIISDEDGKISYALGFEHNRPTPASWVGVYALAPNGIPVADFRMGGIGQPFEPPSPANCFPVFLGSDSRQRWGHKCPRCNGYYRNGTHPAIYPITCPYCGLRAAAFNFLTPAQRAYVSHYIDTLLNGIDSIKPGTEEHLEIDMDAVADLEKGVPRPDFYYTTEAQQTRYSCSHCGDFNDIRGRFGYCASCGWRNNLQSLSGDFETLRTGLNAKSVSAENTLRSAISEFDACARDFVSQLAKRIPMKPTRKSELERLLFHDIDSVSITRLNAAFDIDILAGLREDVAFIRMMFHRRHIFEHNAGVTDERYVTESGDATARPGVLLRETQPNVHRMIGCLARMAQNFDRDFHDIFAPTRWPIEYHDERQRRQKGAPRR